MKASKIRVSFRRAVDRFYVYAYLNGDGSPYYIGKGSGKRATMPHDCEAKVPDDKDRILMLRKALTEEEACFLEGRLISQYGRKANGTGTLLNIQPGRLAATEVRYSDLSNVNNAIAHNACPPDGKPVLLGYCRVSTDAEGQDGAYQAQEERLIHAGCDRVIRERESGRKADREGLAEVMAMVNAGKVEELIVTRVDRLGRDAAQADTLLALCDLKGVRVRALDGGAIETASPQGFLLARVMTTMAEVESRMLSQRIRRNFDVYRAQGRHLRRRMPFGYTAGPDHRLAPHPENWAHALRVIAELRRCRSFAGAAHTLTTWCPWTPAGNNLQAWFTNPIIRGHVGHLRQGGKGWDTQWGEIHYDQHPALISESEWQELADDLRRTRSRFTGPTIDARHGLTGLLICHSCGHRLRRNTAQGTAWWRCRHRLCNARGGIRERDVLPLVVAACVDAADTLAIAAAATPDEDPVLVGKRRDLDQVRALAARNPSLAPMVAALEQEIRSIERRPVVTPDAARYAELMRDPSFFSGATPEQQRAIFGALLAGVQVGPGGRPLVMLPRR